MYTLIPLTPNADQFFEINDNGEIYVTGDLMTTTTNSFTLAVNVSDGGGLFATENLECTFDITRNDFNPVFTNLPATLPISSNVLTQGSIFTASATDQDPSVCHIL